MVNLFQTGQGNGLSNSDYRVVLLKRSSGNDFMPNNYVFPGMSIGGANVVVVFVCFGRILAYPYSTLVDY